MFKNYIVIKERVNGLIRYKKYNRNNRVTSIIPFKVHPATPYMINNMEYDTNIFRFSIESLSLPESIYDLNLDNDIQTLKKQKKVGGNFSSENYTSTRFMARSRHGVKIPISLVHRKGLRLNGKNPLLIYAYGAYGSSINPYFEQEVISLLDRGFVYAVVNIRGGAELGQQWYEDGKLLKKKNSFFDFIDATEYLIEKKYSSPKKVYGWGESAGGLLMGAVVNMRPDLYKGILTQVPFVDALTTMLDPSLPLTIGEYDEWGNPEEKKYYDYIKSYSPYDNLKRHDYPHMLVTSGLHDSQVQYWEPTKYVAKLRTLKTDNNLLLLKTDMNAGHSGASGRVAKLKQTALNFSFLLSLEEMKP